MHRSYQEEIASTRSRLESRRIHVRRCWRRGVHKPPSMCRLFRHWITEVVFRIRRRLSQFYEVAVSTAAAFTCLIATAGEHGSLDPHEINHRLCSYSNCPNSTNQGNALAENDVCDKIPRSRRWLNTYILGDCREIDAVRVKGRRY
jgi:hypothetical protein